MGVESNFAIYVSFVYIKLLVVPGGMINAKD